MAGGKTWSHTHDKVEIRTTVCGIHQSERGTTVQRVDGCDILEESAQQTSVGRLPEVKVDR
jgi:hypothetical protein